MFDPAENRAVIRRIRRRDADFHFQRAIQQRLRLREIVAVEQVFGRDRFKGNEVLLRRQIGAASKTSKADLVAALKEGLAECDKAYSSLTDAKATEMIEGRGGKRTRLGVLYGNTIHLEHEYAQMAVHLRLKGIVPPSSEGRRRP